MSTLTIDRSLDWARVDLTKLPRIVTAEVPGPKSQEMHSRAAAIMKGYSSRVILRMSPPIFMEIDVAAKCMDIIEEAIWETEKKFGYC